MLSNKAILITGGTGSFGRAFIKYILEEYSDIERIVVFSRDEQKQFEMALEFSPKVYPIRYILGDVRDKAQLYRAMQDIDIVIHSSAMKHVGASEQNPMECVKTNILGSQNIIDVSLERGVKQVIALSTDKSVNPSNVYGASKLILEKLFISADAQKMEEDIKFSIVRYGNIFGSKGSVIPLL
ncbi:MAG: SDR family NAD(P)-dependent oxidoreductase [Sulfurovum sp.]|nr:SDR family NAD(P)-dependent oxidoreductase [Sulfurovum sp.]